MNRRLFHGPNLHVSRVLIHTPLQRGENKTQQTNNRFSGFRHGVETVETVSTWESRSNTPRKRGVNESQA
jgi:hypothetical protein